MNEDQWITNYYHSATTGWTKSEDKLFEEAIVVFPEGISNRWNRIAEMVPGKTPEEVRLHYEALVRDVFYIESGLVELPKYIGDDDDDEELFSPETEPSTSSAQPKKKGVPWTVEEHRLFLKGVDQFGWGDWRNISRQSVVTKSPSQVASHAQKYQLRQNDARKERKRSSIHDITCISGDCKTVTAPAINRNQNQEGR